MNERSKAAEKWEESKNERERRMGKEGQEVRMHRRNEKGEMIK